MPQLAPLVPLPSSVKFTPFLTQSRTPPSPLSPLSPLSFLSELECSTPLNPTGLATAKKLLSDLIDLVDDVQEIFKFPTEEDDFVAEKKRYYK